VFEIKPGVPEKEVTKHKKIFNMDVSPLHPNPKPRVPNPDTQAPILELHTPVRQADWPSTNSDSTVSEDGGP
jgi:hypothetical protein